MLVTQTGQISANCSTISRVFSSLLAMMKNKRQNILFSATMTDEVDEMLNLGFRAQLFTLMDALPLKRQNLLFSATLDEDVEKLIGKFFLEPQYIELIARGTPIDKIYQRAYPAPNFYTKINLVYICKNFQACVNYQGSFF